MGVKRKHRDYYNKGKPRRVLTEKIRKLMGKNKSNEEIMVKLGIRSALLSGIQAEVLNADTNFFESMTSGGVYSDYLMKSKGMIKKLHKLQTEFKGRGQYTALVAAIKQEKDIYDSIIKHGQDFGFIQKKSQSLEVTNTLTFGNLTDKELKAEIQKEMTDLNRMAKGNTIDMRPELLGVADDVESFIPANVANIPEEFKGKISVKVKVKRTLRKNV